MRELIDKKIGLSDTEEVDYGTEERLWCCQQGKRKQATSAHRKLRAALEPRESNAVEDSRMNMGHCFPSGPPESTFGASCT